LHNGRTEDEVTDDEAKRKMEAKVAKLYRLAEHPNTPPEEAANASAQAAAIMEKYALDELLVAKAAGQTTSDVLVKKSYNYKGVYNYADAMLVWRLAEACGLKAIRSNMGGNRIQMNVVGFEGDFGRFEVLLTSAMLQRVNATNAYIRSLGGRWDYQTASQKYNTKRSYMVGYAEGLAQKVIAAHNQVVQEVKVERGSGAELVLVERKDQVEKFYAKVFPGAGTARGVKITGSYSQGRADGRSANIGGTGLGGTRRAIG
jgi:hypothetical protein